MTRSLSSDHRVDPEIYEPVDPQDSTWGLSRREFVQVLGAGLLITVSGEIALAQRRGGRGGGRGFGGRGPANIAARLHIDRNGAVTVMTGKVEVGQGSRAELTQAAAEELRLDPAHIRLIMADTVLTPDDGTTAGSGSTPRTVPSIRSGAAAARELLLDLAAQRWKVDRAALRVHDGAIIHESTKRAITYAELAQAEDFAKTLAQPIPGNVAVAAVKEWKVLGTSLPRPNRRDIVMGAHHYPSDILRPKMLHGKILRPPAFGATLVSIDLAAVRSLAGVAVMRDGSLVGCAAPTSLEAQRAVEALAKTAKWEAKPQQVSSKDLFPHCARPPTGRSGPRWRRISRRKEGAPRKLRGRLYSARADGAAGRRGRVGRRQAHRLDRHPESLRCPRRVGLRPGRAWRERAGDRARHGRRVRRKTQRRSGGRSGPPGPGGQAPRLVALVARGGVHLGLLPAGGCDRDPRCSRCCRLVGGVGLHQRQRRWLGHRVALCDCQEPLALELARMARCGKAPIVPWPLRPTISPASRSWTSWRMRPRPIRWHSAWHI